MTNERCNLGVGCEEAGMCYALAKGRPEKCGRHSPKPRPAPITLEQAKQKLKDWACDPWNKINMDHEIHDSQVSELSQRNTDLVLEGRSEWSFTEVDELAKLFETDMIDREGGGCASCGFGDTVVIRGVLEPQ